MLMGITDVSQQSSRDGLFAKAWCPTHSSSTARARAGAGKMEWFAGDHGSKACISEDCAERRPRRAHDRRTEVQRGRASGQKQQEPREHGETQNLGNDPEEDARGGLI